MKVGSGRNPINLVPVDYVVEGIARLAAMPGSRGKTYHLTDPEPLTVAEVADLFARALGKSFVYVPVPAALARLLFSPLAIQRFFGVPAESLAYFDHACRYDAAQATADLAPQGVRCPRFSEYAQRLVAFYREKKGSVRREAMI